MELSELWLDTEFTSVDFDFIARELVDSKLSIDELEEVYSYEIAPIFYSFYPNITGEWASFDKEWIIEQVSKHLEKQDSIFFYRTFVRSSLGKYLITRTTKTSWDKLLVLYKSKQKT